VSDAELAEVRALVAEVRALVAEVRAYRAELAKAKAVTPAPRRSGEAVIVPIKAPEPTPARDLYPVSEVAATLAISERQAWRLVLSGELESVHLGRLRRVPASAVDDYIAARRGQV
jgi:excisionase family DNA binding protein